MLYTALETQAQALGYSLENTNATMDANKQIDQMNEVIAKKPGAIILLPVEANALKPSVEKANEAGVPVIITNRDLTGGKTAQVHSDEEQAGRMQGEYMAKHLRRLYISLATAHRHRRSCAGRASRRPASTSAPTSSCSR